MAELPNNTMDNEFKVYKSMRSCLNVFQLPFEHRCEYVRSSDDCEQRAPMINYVEIMVCDMNIVSTWDEIQIMLLLTLIIAFYAHVIAIVADRYFAPALKIIVKNLHISEHLAGVTILAFANNLADLFGKLYFTGTASPLFANSLSGALVVTMLSGGIICFMRPFRMSPNGIVRDLLFFILGITICDYFVAKDIQISFKEAIYLMAYYLVYIVVIVIDGILVKREIRDVKSLLIKMKNRVHRDRIEEKLIERKLHELKNDSKIEIKVRRKKNIYSEAEIVDVEGTRTALYVPGSPRNRNLFIGFFEDIIPINTIRWQTTTFWPKVFMLIKAPTHLFCIFYIPRVDLEENKHAWSKLLNCLNIITMPSITAVITISFIVKSDFFWKLHLNPAYILYPMPITVPLAFTVFLYTRTDLPPRYHSVLALMNLFACIVIFFICEAEISEITILICQALQFSEDFTGATLGAFSHSIGDLVVNTVISLHGYSQMAFATALGGPFFNLVFITGFSFLSDFIHSDKAIITVYVGLFGETVFIFILLAVSTTLFWALVLNFQARRSVGVYSLLLYAIFLTMAILVEAEIIHSWAADKNIQFPNI